MRDYSISTSINSLHPSGTPHHRLPIPAPSTSRRADIPEADTPPRKRLLLTTPRPGCEIGESSAAAAARQPGPTIETRLLDTERRIMTALEWTLEARITLLETEARRHDCLAGQDASSLLSAYHALTFSRVLCAPPFLPWRLERALTPWWGYG
ncbi:hypothetical protein Tco_0682528 [Tanacetum coccineum]|uniref:Uncharacterized protein n=1 Tax=Tanacetum coccineum TaxID=301880 RepID=A0ABQ4XRD6_9ASTR